MRLERQVTVVLQPHDTTVRVAENGDGEVEVAVAIEIAGLDVGDATDAAEQRARNVSVTAREQDRHCAELLIVRKQIAEDRNHDVAGAIAIDVGHRRVTRNLQVLGQYGLGPRADRRLPVPQNRARTAVACDHVAQAVGIEVHDL